MKCCPLLFADHKHLRTFIDVFRCANVLQDSATFADLQLRRWPMLLADLQTTTTFANVGQRLQTYDNIHRYTIEAISCIPCEFTNVQQRLQICKRQTSDSIFANLQALNKWQNEKKHESVYEHHRIHQRSCSGMVLAGQEVALSRAHPCQFCHKTTAQSVGCKTVQKRNRTPCRMQ